jgi:hypothetical protein
VNYFYQATLQTDVTVQDKLLDKARQSFKKAIMLKSASVLDNSFFWNALGVVEKNLQHKQHAFLKAISLDSKVKSVISSTDDAELFCLE